MSLHLDNNPRFSRESSADSGQTEEFVLEDLLDGPVKRPSASKIYKSPEAKAADARTTALSFFLVGGLGLAATLLTMTGIISLPIHGMTLYSMTFFFLLFLVIGFFSQRSAKKILEKAPVEHEKIRKITDWYETEGIKSEELQKLLTEGDREKPEVFYLQKYELVSRLLHRQFPSMDEALLDKLASDFSEEERIDAMLEEQVRIEAAIEEQKKH